MSGDSIVEWYGIGPAMLLAIIVIARMIYFRPVLYLVERTAVIWAAVGVACLGASRLLWMGHLPKTMTYTVRIFCVVYIAYFLLLHVRYWARTHSKSFARPDDEILQSPELLQLHGIDARQQYEDDLLEISSEIDLNSVPNVECLLEQLIRPASFRRQIHETARMEYHSMFREVTLHLPIRRLNTCASGVTLVSVARPPKGDAFRGTSVIDRAGFVVEAVNYRHTQAIIYAVVRKQMAVHVTDAPVLDALLTRLADLIAQSEPNADEAANIRDLVIAAAGAAPPSAGEVKTLHAILEVAATRRPIIVLYHDPNDPEVSVIIRSVDTVTKNLAVPTGIRQDRYRRATQWIRNVVGISSTQIFIPIRRARSCDTYQLTFTAPPGTYIQETHGYANCQSKWLPNDLNRHGLYRAFAGWTEPNGRNEASFATRNFGSTGITDVYFYVRMCERPPGTAGKAMLVACATAVVVWLCGALPTAPGANNVDIVALALALPGVAAVWFGLNDEIRPTSLRSIPALVAMVVSGLVSLGAIIAYMGMGTPPPGEKPRVPLSKWGNADSFFMVDSKVWSILLSLAAINFACIALSLLVAMYRFRRITR